MYDLVLKVPDGLAKLKELLESYIINQGLEAIDKCCDAAINVSDFSFNVLTQAGGGNPNKNQLFVSFCQMIFF
jgi:hypothetical protein